MRRVALLSAICATGLLTGSVTARMGGDPNRNSGSSSKSDNMSAKVDFQTFDLDGQVHDLMWCGYNDETILMHTTDGTIYRSRDRGLSWKRLRNLLQKQGVQVADESQEVSALGDFYDCVIFFDFLNCVDRPRAQNDSEPDR